ncbi:unnamed protein product, partial [Didymodactylos carnosus]
MQFNVCHHQDTSYCVTVSIEPKKTLKKLKEKVVKALSPSARADDIDLYYNTDKWRKLHSGRLNETLIEMKVINEIIKNKNVLFVHPKEGGFIQKPNSTTYSKTSMSKTKAKPQTIIVVNRLLSGQPLYLSNLNVTPNELKREAITCLKISLPLEYVKITAGSLQIKNEYGETSLVNLGIDGNDLITIERIIIPNQKQKENVLQSIIRDSKHVQEDNPSKQENDSKFPITLVYIEQSATKPKSFSHEVLRTQNVEQLTKQLIQLLKLSLKPDQVRLTDQEPNPYQLVFDKIKPKQTLAELGIQPGSIITFEYTDQTSVPKHGQNCVRERQKSIPDEVSSKTKTQVEKTVDVYLIEGRKKTEVQCTVTVEQNIEQLKQNVIEKLKLPLRTEDIILIKYRTNKKDY